MSGALTPPAPPAGAAPERVLASGLLERAGAARERGDLAAAEDGFRAALAPLALLEDVHGVARALSQIAALRATAGDHEAAAALYRQAVERAPANVVALTGLAYALWRGGHAADGEVTFGRALRQDRRAVRALAGRGQIRAELGSPAEALADLDQAAALDRTGAGSGHLTPGGRADLMSARALAFAAGQRFAEADAELRSALDLAPDRPRTLARAGRIAVLAGHPPRAGDLFRRALRQVEAAVGAGTGFAALSAAEKRAVNRALSLLGTGTS